MKNSIFAVILTLFGTLSWANVDQNLENCTDISTQSVCADIPEDAPESYTLKSSLNDDLKHDLMLKPEDIQVSHINWNHPIAESLAFVPISIEPSPQELSQNLSDAYVHFVNQHNFVNEPNRFLPLVPASQRR